jgi:hypothetical protein
VEPELHKTIAIEARKRGQGINSLVSEALSKAIEETIKQGHAQPQKPDGFCSR